MNASNERCAGDGIRPTAAWYALVAQNVTPVPFIRHNPLR